MKAARTLPHSQVRSKGRPDALLMYLDATGEDRAQQQAGEIGHGEAVEIGRGADYDDGGEFGLAVGGDVARTASASSALGRSEQNSAAIDTSGPASVT